MRVGATAHYGYHLSQQQLALGIEQSRKHPQLVEPEQHDFGLLFSYNVDGQIYAQPLYMHGLRISGALQNVVFVATENNSVYAFDADSNSGSKGGLIWHVNFNSGAQGVVVTPVSTSDLGGCGDITPNVGITGTPVIDPSSSTLYVVAVTKEVSGGSTVSSRFLRIYRADR
jgi:hypothetical protein